MKPEIKFGTDGWRAIIADTYTFANVQKVAQATGRWVLNTYGDDASVVVGYDTRFLGEQFAKHTARVLASMGITVHLSDGYTSTPIVSWATLAYGCSHGVVITASHNPPHYNGFKLKAHFGGPSTPAMIAAVEAELPHVAGTAQDLQSFEALQDAGLIHLTDFTPAYLDVIRDRVDVEAIRQSDLKIAYDAMFGSGQGMVSELLGEDRVLTLHHDDNPGFHGQAPEPIDRNLQELSAYIKTHNCDVGLATDGDADRIGLYDENGDFVDSHRILSLLVDYLYNDKGLRGDIVKSFAATDLLDRMGAAYGLPVHTTPIGFKYIAARMIEGNVLVGGEESGGLAAMGHIPERDGIFVGLLVVEMMVKRGKKLSTLVADLFDQFGPHYAYRSDLHITENLKQAFLKHLREKSMDEIAGQPIDHVDTLDGFKFRTTSGPGPWVMIRPSGTEPVLRVYAEAANAEGAEALVQGVVDVMNTLDA